MSMKPMQVSSVPLTGMQAGSVPMQAGSLPMQAATVPAQTSNGGMDMGAIMELMITMMIVVMMMKMMTGAMGNI